MNRRTFNRLFAATVTAAGISSLSPAEGFPLQQARLDVSSVVPPSGGSGSLELVILDAAPPHLSETGSTAVDDIDGDGRTEVVIGGNGALLWYRPSLSQRGVIALGRFGVGVALGDIDGDGRKEVIAGKMREDETWVICWYKSSANLHDSWTEHVLDGAASGHPHDIVFGDVDGDGRDELIANAIYCEHPGLFAYKALSDPTRPWKKQVVQDRYSAEGTVTGDLDRDGKEEIVSGPYWYSPPGSGAFSGQLWEVHSLAPGFRELCRASLIDVNRDGRLDVVLVEDEYPDGRLAWFENRLTAGRKNSWIAHPIDAPLNFAHSLRAWHDGKTNVSILAGEMNEGGWSAPYNWDARLLEYTSADRGKSWRRKLIYEGEGTHEAVRADLDGSGTKVIFGHSSQVIAKTSGYTGWVQMFRPQPRPSGLQEYKHSFVDRDKPYTGIDIHAVDVDHDGRLDIVCGAWWYKNPTWERHVIPGVVQIINAYDLDKDGRKELIGIKPKTDRERLYDALRELDGRYLYRELKQSIKELAGMKTSGSQDFYSLLSSDLVWLKPIDLSKDLWEEHYIGTGDGDWPHGNTIAPLLPDGRAALVCGYHHHTGSPPQIFELPEDPKRPWNKRTVGDIPYGEEMIAYDLDGDGKLDIVAGPYWLRNLGDGRFETHLLVDPGYLKSANLNMISRIAISDVNGDGRPDILFAVEDVDWNIRKAYFAPVGWLENTGSLRDGKFNVHVIDRVRSPHSISVGDLDGDGETEVIVGEHDPFHPYRSKCRLYAYKKADAKGLTWSRHPIDNRFEHHDGAKVVELTPGNPTIISHGWMEPAYVHIWGRDKQ